MNSIKEQGIGELPPGLRPEELGQNREVLHAPEDRPVAETEGLRPIEPIPPKSFEAHEAAVSAAGSKERTDSQPKLTSREDLQRSLDIGVDTIPDGSPDRNAFHKMNAIAELLDPEKNKN